LGYNLNQAYQDVRDLHRVWFTLLPSWSTLDRAETLISNYSLSFWDALIIAACLEAGVTRLYSEDFDAYARVDGLQIVNPFKTAAAS
jgi:predicted nucleic acid-binding protein